MTVKIRINKPCESDGRFKRTTTRPLMHFFSLNLGVRRERALEAKGGIEMKGNLSLCHLI